MKKNAKIKYSNIRGTTDYLPWQVSVFEKLRQESLTAFKLYGYRQLIMPLLEEKGLFVKGVGRATDIVQNQMMKIEGKEIVLRPEATAQIVRYYLQNRLDKKNNFYKFFYIGPMFRGERPQKGRLRQFTHIGAEALGSGSFCLDAENIALAVNILDRIGLKKKELQLNSLGCREDKKRFSSYLKKKLAKSRDKLCPDCRRRLDKNPLRAVDCKKSGCRKIINSLDLGESHLCPDCRKHFANLCKVLEDSGIKYKYNPYLVRGLDYYTNTVFEIISGDIGSQNALGAGGRYNNLFNRLGGIDIPAVGFALGVERIMLALGRRKPEASPFVFVARAGKNLDSAVFSLLASLRANGLAADCDFSDKSLKAQFRYAARKNADFVVIAGEEELKQKKVILRDMKKSSQAEIDRKRLVPVLKKKVHEL